MTKASNDALDDLEAVRTIVGALEKFQRTDQQRILRWAQEKIGIASAPATVLPAAGPSQSIAAAQVATAPPSNIDIKAFIERKKPSSDNQLTAAIAYYYMFEAPEAARKSSIKSDDLVAAARALGQGGKFKRPSQTLVNAHHQGLLDRSSAGGYVLSHVGENLVAVALGAEGKAPMQRTKTSRGRKTKGKTATKKARR